MSILRPLLTAIYCILSGIGIVGILLGNVSLQVLILVILYIASGMALNNMGEKLARNLALFTGGILCFGFLGALYSVLAPFLGDTFDVRLLLGSLVIGGVGAGTLVCLLKSPDQQEAN